MIAPVWVTNGWNEWFRLTDVVKVSPVASSVFAVSFPDGQSIYLAADMYADVCAALGIPIEADHA